MGEYLMGDIVQRFIFKQELCNLCGTCVESCDFNAITIEDNELFFNPCRCRRCDGCENLCPKGAMHLEMGTINMKPVSEKKVQERYWELNSSCHITCDGLCSDCNGLAK